MAETTETNASAELLKAKLEAQKKDKLVHLLVGLVAGLVVGFFGANWLNARPAAAPAPAATATATGELPADHPPVEGGAGGASGAAMPEVQAKLKAADESPQDYDAQFEAAAMFFRIQNYDKALEYLRRADKIKPNDPDTMLALANTLSYAGKQTEAISYFEKVKSAKPSDPEVYIGLGLAYFKENQHEKTIEAVQKALAAEPNNEFALQLITEAYIQKGDAANAEASLNQLASVNPQAHVLTHLREDLNALKTTGKIPTH